ncbi:N-acetylneuraminate synthase [Candidatus Woesearchaeota archaeon]|nr:MAG: N-acetylneuraminate synthase [Candidatus Woesearchaeota archaeon]
MDAILLPCQKSLGIGKSVFIIVDIGKNHMGNIELAKFLIDKAAEAGVDAVKFQTHVVDDEQRKEHVISPHYAKPRYEWLKKNTYPLEWWKELAEHAKKKNIIFFSTPMSVAAVDLLEQVGVPLYKVGSGDVTDLFLLEAIGRTGKPVILSSGMSELHEVERAVKTLKIFTDKVVLMHCVSEYPCPPEHLNLRVIQTLQQKFALPVGLSDHVLEFETAYAAVALGAVALEKHLTLDRQLPGPDHKVSLIPSELSLFVRQVRNVEKSLGDGVKRVLEGEAKFRPVFHKSIVARVPIKKGTVIEKALLTVKRPGGGFYPHELEKVIGKKAANDIAQDALLLPSDLA